MDVDSVGYVVLESGGKLSIKVDDARRVQSNHLDSVRGKRKTVRIAVWRESGKVMSSIQVQTVGSMDGRFVEVTRAELPWWVSNGQVNAMLIAIFGNVDLNIYSFAIRAYSADPDGK
jgi:hypothetical protein